MHRVQNLSGSNPCRGAKPVVSICYKELFLSMYEFCTKHLRA
jgi:hypothetical protein